ncbi:hypothetical protein XH89_19810 [Bradyrhizobium sp. CCBAU 53340]|nr:hypothetical protein XH89_19810 [Bradyrhizobium sp. CCBAU 53340]
MGPMRLRLGCGRSTCLLFEGEEDHVQLWAWERGMPVAISKIPELHRFKRVATGASPNGGQLQPFAGRFGMLWMNHLP